MLLISSVFFSIYLINISCCNLRWSVARLWEGYVYSVIVSFGVIVSFRFSVFIVKGIFGVHATVVCVPSNLRSIKLHLFFLNER